MPGSCPGAARIAKAAARAECSPSMFAAQVQLALHDVPMCGTLSLTLLPTWDWPRQNVALGGVQVAAGRVHP
jgi:hypothetical protein